MEFQRTRRKKIEISLIPLIDVSMFLLIFFMLAGSIERFEIIPVDPPVAQSGKLMDEGHVVILLGRHDEAEDSYRRSIEILSALASDRPGDAEHRDHLD